MSVDAVKRVVALTRQKASYRSMVRQGHLTEAEGASMVALCDAEIATIRAQASLSLEQEPGVQPGAAPKGGSAKS